MKTKINYLVIMAFTVILSGFVSSPARAQGGVSFQVFYDDLDPYGQWVNYPSYGYVWVPAAGPDFMPYSTGGYWALTDYGWTWVSDYSWGWAPFHYGRWDYVDYYGWVWIPGNEWGPAWVVWRDSPGYYGWAPLTPGISVNVAIGGGYSYPPDHWVFVNDHYMGDHDIHHHYGPRGNNQNLINNSTVINNTYIDNSTHNTYIVGPRGEDVQRATGKPVQPIAVRNGTKPGQNIKDNQLEIYRPEVGRGDAKPTRVADKNDVKPVAERPNNATKPRDTKANTPAQRDATQPTNKVNRTPQPQQPANNTKQPAQRQPQRGNTDHTPEMNQPATPRTQQPPKRVKQPAQQQKPVQREQPNNQPVPQRQVQPQPEQQAPVNRPVEQIPERREPQQQPQQQPEPQREQPRPQPQPQVQPQQQAPVQQPKPQAQPQRQPRPH